MQMLGLSIAAWGMSERTEAERYLQRLDPSAKSWTFQTFVDEKGKKNHNVTGILIGSLDDHWDKLVRRNRNGAGVFDPTPLLIPDLGFSFHKS